MIGQTLSHFRITAKLGEGGMGSVWSAEDTKLGREVAIKVLSDEFTTDRDRLARFEREARVLASLNHPHICTIHEIGEHEGRPFLVMELMEGKALEQWITEEPLPTERLLKIVAQVSDALATAHAAGIIHRDIKPANIFITEHGEAKVLDFGLAKVGVEPGGPPPGTELPTELLLTTPGATIGTVSYMSPEQVLGREVDERTDLFSLGVVIYEMATAKRPFVGKTSAAVSNEILEKSPTAPVRLNPEIPAELERIVDKLLEKDRTLRYPSAKDLRVDLGRLQKESSTSVNPREAGASKLRGDRQVRPLRRGLWATMGAAAAVLLVGAGLWLASRSEKPPQPEATGLVEPEVAAASIAVLAFADMSPEKDQAYFADGLAEELLNLLMQIDGLRVAARSSSFSFRDKDVDIETIGEQLGVATLLEGSVRKAGNRLRITVQLISASDGFHFWSQTYDRELDDIFAVQDDIARSVAESLQLTLLGEYGTRSSSRSDSVEAYNLYLQARHLARLRRGPEDFERSIRYAEEALALDPGYAPAWVALAYARNNQVDTGYVSHEDGLAGALPAIAKALELDETLAEAWAVLGEIRMELQWDWPGAAAALERARELEPENPEVVRRRAELASVLGRSDEAVEIARRALELDPLNPMPYAVLANTLIDSGRYSEARATAERRLELDPGKGPWTQVRIDLARGHPEAAFDVLDPLPDSSARTFYLAQAYHALGRQREAETMLSDFIQEYQETEAYSIARLYSLRQEADEAFRWLDLAYSRHESQLRGVKAERDFFYLHDDPRWLSLLERMELEG